MRSEKDAGSAGTLRGKSSNDIRTLRENFAKGYLRACVT
jgi:hypothetical protein